MTGRAVDPHALKLLRAGRLVEALPFAERAVAGATVCVPGHALLASILLRLARPADAESVVRHATSLPCASVGDGGGDGDDGGNGRVNENAAAALASAYDGLAYVAVELTRHELANDLYRRVTRLDSGNPRHWYNLAASERSFGRLEAAEQACDRAIGIDPAHHPSYLLRAELRVQTTESNHVEALRRRLATPGLDIDARIFVGYALGKELDDQGRVDEAFPAFAAAAAARRSQIRYDVTHDERLMERLADAFDGPSWREPGGGGDHIFVVGLPRSGTTLVERIVGGLAGVHSNGETDNLSRAVAAGAPPGPARPSDPSDGVVRVARAESRVVASEYERLARERIAPGPDRVTRIVEKLPGNYLYLGAIRRALPDARIVLVSRSPLDSCFAMYRTLFGEAYPFSYDFAELARYYAAYHRLMTHWRGNLGDRLHEVVYEDLVREPGRVGRAVAEHCGLAWSERALDIQNNRAVSLTASAAQVRRPIYGTSSGRWRLYRRHLGPLIEAMRSQGIALPVDA